MATVQVAVTLSTSHVAWAISMYMTSSLAPNYPHLVSTVSSSKYDDLLFHRTVAVSWSLTWSKRVNYYNGRKQVVSLVWNGLILNRGLSENYEQDKVLLLNMIDLNVTTNDCPYRINTIFIRPENITA